jgi:hypothetical protein
MSDIDERFDNLERIWDRSQKLILKVLGGVVGIALAAYVGYDQIKNKNAEINGRGSLSDQHHIEKSTDVHGVDYELVKKTYFVDDYGYREGDTVYVDYYSDGYIDKYYTDLQTYVDDYVEEDNKTIVY